MLVIYQASSEWKWFDNFSIQPREEIVRRVFLSFAEGIQQFTHTATSQAIKTESVYRKQAMDMDVQQERQKKSREEKKVH